MRLEEDGTNADSGGISVQDEGSGGASEGNDQDRGGEEGGLEAAEGVEGRPGRVAGKGTVVLVRSVKGAARVA